MLQPLEEGACPFILESEPGKQSHTSMLEGGQAANYYLLMQSPMGTDFLALPSSEWYNFKPAIKYNTLSLDEAQAVMERRRGVAELVRTQVQPNVEEYLHLQKSELFGGDVRCFTQLILVPC